MEISEAIKKRRSVREFKETSISKEIEEKLIQALIWAPSAGNLQARKFYFVKNKEVKESLTVAALNQEFISQAPLVVVGCTDSAISRRYGERGKNIFSICDAAAAIENLTLQACEFGLGTCWVGAFDEKEVAKILNLPENLRPIVILPVGYPAEKPSAPPRKKKEDLIEEIN